MENNIKLVTKILRPSFNLGDLDFYWLTGSTVGGHSSDNIDIIAGVSCLDSEIINILSEKIISSKGLAFGLSIFDDALRFKTTAGITISLGLYNSKEIFQRLEKYTEGKDLNGEKRPWALSAWLPESFCADIVSSYALYDKNGLLDQARGRLSPYPNKLATALKLLADQEIKQKSRLLNSPLAAERMLAATDLITTITRAIFAQNQRYFSGFKRLPEQLLGLNGKLPGRLAEFWHGSDSVNHKIIELKNLIKEFNDENNDNGGNQENFS